MYTIQEEGGRRYLHAASQGLGIQAAKEITWDLARYPVLAWSWRPVEFPTGADERKLEDERQRAGRLRRLSPPDGIGQIA